MSVALETTLACAVVSFGIRRDLLAHGGEFLARIGHLLRALGHRSNRVRNLGERLVQRFSHQAISSLESISTRGVNRPGHNSDMHDFAQRRTMRLVTQSLLRWPRFDSVPRARNRWPNASRGILRVSANHVDSEETTAQANVVSSATDMVNRNLQTVATGAEEMTSTIQDIARNATDSAE